MKNTTFISELQLLVNMGQKMMDETKDPDNDTGLEDWAEELNSYGFIIKRFGEGLIARLRKEDTVGEIADMHINGEVCEHCGVYLDGKAPGYPRYCCDDCSDAAKENAIPTVLPPDQREDVARFHIKMLEKLEENIHKGGWRDETPGFLKSRLTIEFIEFKEAMSLGYPAEMVMKEAADVANFAMMLASNYGRAFK